MEGVLQVLGFGSRVIDKEKAGEHQHSTTKEDGNVTNTTVAVTYGCGSINNPQEISVRDVANNPPQGEGNGSDGSSDDTELL
eukprot:599214-Ditylum_brightwellii.AAC.1